MRIKKILPGLKKTLDKLERVCYNKTIEKEVKKMQELKISEGVTLIASAETCAAAADAVWWEEESSLRLAHFNKWVEAYAEAYYKALRQA